MPVTDALGWVHGTPSTPAAYLTAGSAYSTDELFTGAVLPGTAYPYLTQFPSKTEDGYTFPPEIPGVGGVEWGLHIVIGVAFDTLTSVNFQIVTSATTNALFSSSPNPIGARTLTLAQMAIAGAHYFISANAPLLAYTRFYGALTGSNNSNGTLMAWFGPRTGGEQ